MKLKEKDIVEIEWLDSVSSNNWLEKSSYEDEPNTDYLRQKTVGYFLSENKESITVMQSYGTPNKNGDYSTNQRITIPRCAIIKTRGFK